MKLFAHTRQGGGDLIVKLGLDRLARIADRAHDGEADQRHQQSVLHRRRTVFVGREAAPHTHANP